MLWTYFNFYALFHQWRGDYGKRLLQSGAGGNYRLCSFTFVRFIHCQSRYFSLDEYVVNWIVNWFILTSLLTLLFHSLFYYLFNSSALLFVRKSSEQSSATWKVSSPSPVPTLMSFPVSLMVILFITLVFNCLQTFYLFHNSSPIAIWKKKIPARPL